MAATKKTKRQAYNRHLKFNLIIAFMNDNPQGVQLGMIVEALEIPYGSIRQMMLDLETIGILTGTANPKVASRRLTYRLTALGHATTFDEDEQRLLPENVIEKRLAQGEKMSIIRKMAREFLVGTVDRGQTTREWRERAAWWRQQPY